MSTMTMNTTKNYRHAAVVLKSLTKRTANRFLNKLDPSLSQLIVMEMRRTRVTAANLREAIEKLKSEGIGIGPSNSTSSHRRHFRDGDSVNRIDSAHRSFGDRAGLEVQPNLDFSKAGTMAFEKDPFDFLLGHKESLLIPLFNDLKIRSAAVILSAMSFEFASKRFKTMEDDRKVEVMRAIADLEDLHPAEVIDLKFALRLQIQKMVKSRPELGLRNKLQQDSLAPMTGVAGMMPQLGDLTLVEQGKLIGSLLALPDRQVKKLLQNIDTSNLAPALKTCPIALQKKVIKNMARKPAAILTKEILQVRIDEKHRILKSRHNIAKAIKALD